MRQKIPTEYNDVIYEEYDKLLAVGVPVVEIARLINDKLATDFAESSIRGRYKQEKLRREGADIQDDEEYQKRLLRLAEADIKLMFNRKVIQKERAVVNGLLRESSDKSVCVDAMVRLWDEEPIHNSRETFKVQESDYHDSINYHITDTHYGYVCELAKNPYNPHEAARRVRQAFVDMEVDIINNAYGVVTIVDHGDSIEGSALRVSQLLNIAEDMTRQASSYTDLIIECIEELSQNLPHVRINFVMISSDNHSELRLYNTKRGELPENMQLVIANNVERHIKQAHKYNKMDNVTFVQGDEVIINFGTTLTGQEVNVVCAHGHQYTRKENILEQVEHRHGVPVMAYIGGHWHNFSVKYKNVKNGIQQALIFLPPVVGDTDYSDSLFMSSQPGFCKTKVNSSKGYINAEFISL